MIVACIFFLLLYSASICWLIYGYSKIPDYSTSIILPKTKFSIVVPFRNEAENLPNLLNSFSGLNYPEVLFEVILVDDASEEKFYVDEFLFSIRIVNNTRVSNSPKKDAITTAIAIANNEWIITTDADCTVNPEWLTTLDAFIQEKNPEMVAGSVTYTTGNSFLHHFQQLDIASLQGATIGSFGLNKGFMCNGANFAYSKSFFQKLGGFAGNNDLASGDDVFLLQKAIAQFPGKVHFLKSVQNIVFTKPENSWKSLFHQRVRWAAKTVSYKSDFGKLLGLVVFFGNLFWILSFVYFILEAFPLYALLIIALKLMVDFILIKKTNSFLGNKMRYFLPASFLYPVFSVLVALYSVFGKYEWKGRTFRK